MIPILAYLLLGLGVAAGLLLAVASTRPDSFRTARSARIAAPPEKLFPLIDDLRRMNAWNPFALRETLGTAEYEGPASGTGARFRFAGPRSGTGSIEITGSEPPSRVTMRLLMDKPMKADNLVELTLRPLGSETEVTWAMSGRQPLLGKIVSLFVDCDRMVGKVFEEGLGNLKAQAEQA